LTAAYLIQFVVSGVAVALMVGLVAWATRGRGAPPLDELTARAWLKDEFPGRAIDAIWLGTDGKGAVAKSGDRALVLSRMGVGYVARQVPWVRAMSASVKGGLVRITLSDVAAPKAAIAIAVWPPKDFAA
jgi:hypothetical protein